MAENKQENKRKTIYIKKEFQFKFILKFCLILLAGIVISTALLFFFSQGSLTSSFENSRLVIQSTGLAILPAVIITNLITFCIILIFAVIVTLYISHRIAGPVFRFEKDLCKIENGDLCIRINLRKKDQFSEMALALNNMTERIHTKVSKIDNGIDGIFPMPDKYETCKECQAKIVALKEIMKREFSL